MSTAVDIDVAALVGEMDAVPCESAGHRTDIDAHDGDASHYAHIYCPMCGWTVVKAYCAPFINYISSGGRIRCSQCAMSYSPDGQITILGPVAK